MRDALFDELIASVREGGAILRGEVPPARAFVVEGPDVRGIRNRFQLSQSKFAALLGISVATLRNWEQGRRKPEGPARILLQVAARHPDVVWEVVRAVRSASSPAPLKRPRPHEGLPPTPYFRQLTRASCSKASDLLQGEAGLRAASSRTRRLRVPAGSP